MLAPGRINPFYLSVFIRIVLCSDYGKYTSRLLRNRRYSNILGATAEEDRAKLAPLMTPVTGCVSLMVFPVTDSTVPEQAHHLQILK